VRRPELPQGFRPRMREAHDVLVTALVAAVRRARDMAEAIEARGGHATMPRGRVRLAARDVVTLGLAGAAIVAIAFL